MPESPARIVSRGRAHAVRMGAALYYGGLQALCVPAVRRRWCDAAVVLCYHNVIGEADVLTGAPGLHLRVGRFERQMRWLADHYHIVRLREFVCERSARSSPPLAAVTFDDAYAGVFEHAVPTLERLGIPATVFVVAGAAGQSDGFWWDQPDVVSVVTDAQRERWLHDLCGDERAILSDILGTRAPVPPAYRAADWSTIRAHAGSGIDIGVHSVTHRFLPALSPVELEHEVVASRTLIHHETGVWPEFFAYPYGLCDARVRAAVRGAGYRAAFGLDAGLNAAADDRWVLPRVNIPSGISDDAFEAWTAGLR